MHPWDPDRESVADYSEDACADIVRRALGTDAHPFAVRTIRTWTMTAQVAERYRERRMFLVGDAAHRFPPTGGLGLNTGVQDAHNLAWKIAAVETGWASDALLETYEVERRPIAQRNADVSLQNALRLGEVYQALASGESDALRAAIANQAEHFDMLGLQLGFAYDSGAIVGNGEKRPRAGSVRDYIPNARPSSRVPHAWVTRAGVRVSTLDLCAYARFTLVAGPAAGAWVTSSAARAEATAGPVPIDHVVIGRDVIDEDGRWMTLLGIDASGAVLVRPDQHVAWRSRHGVADPAASVARVLASIVRAEGAVQDERAESATRATTANRKRR